MPHKTDTNILSPTEGHVWSDNQRIKCKIKGVENYQPSGFIPIRVPVGLGPLFFQFLKDCFFWNSVPGEQRLTVGRTLTGWVFLMVQMSQSASNYTIIRAKFFHIMLSEIVNS